MCPMHPPDIDLALRFGPTRCPKTTRRRREKNTRILGVTLLKLSQISPNKSDSMSSKTKMDEQVRETIIADPAVLLNDKDIMCARWLPRMKSPWATTSSTCAASPCNGSRRGWTGLRIRTGR